MAHSGSRSSCKVDFGFVGFLLSLLYFLRFPSGVQFRLRILCCIRFFPSFGLFLGSPVGCVLGFLRFSCRICIGDLFRGVSCSLILSLASMLLPLVWHCIAFCLSMYFGLTHIFMVLFLTFQWLILYFISASFSISSWTLDSISLHTWCFRASFEIRYICSCMWNSFATSFCSFLP